MCTKYRHRVGDGGILGKSTPRTSLTKGLLCDRISINTEALVSVVMDGTNTKVKGMVELTPKQVAELLAKDLILDITSLLGAVD